MRNSRRVLLSSFFVQKVQYFRVLVNPISPLPDDYRRFRRSGGFLVSRVQSQSDSHKGIKGFLVLRAVQVFQHLVGSFKGAKYEGVE